MEDVHSEFCPSLWTFFILWLFFLLAGTDEKLFFRTAGRTFGYREESKGEKKKNKIKI